MVGVKATTFPAVLERHAAATPERRCSTFLERGEPVRALTYGELERASRGVALALREAGLAGERALLVFPPGLDFLIGFLACLRAGVVAVPAYPVSSRRSVPQLAAIAADARPRAVLTVAAQLDRYREPCREVAALTEPAWWAIDTLEPAEEGGATLPPPAPDDLAFLQYTSGSTARPRGVMVRHAHLLHNEEVIRRACGYSPETVMVSWLPPYHDMGLIGALLQPLYLGASSVLMAPVDFLQKPSRWLEAISRFRATTSGGPNFAYDLCVDRSLPAERQDLDLSSWQVAFNGAEPVRAGTLERFAATFALQGFRREAFLPCYGLAEATLFVTGVAPAGAPRTVALAARELEQGRAFAAPAGVPARRLVGCGEPGLGLRVEIVDAAGRPCAPGHVGEIWIAGPSVAGGYWQRPEASAATFEARLLTEPEVDPFLRTGDLGFVQDGELFVSGRSKDLLILRGRNHHPEDLEHTALAAHPGLATGGAAAFVLESDEREPALVLLCEIRREQRAPFEPILATLRQAISAAHELRLNEVALVRPGALPRTTSGKIQRHRCREAWAAGEIAVVAGSRLAAETPAPEAGRVAPSAAGPPAPALLAAVAALLAVGPDELRAAPSLTALGLDSLRAATLRERLAEQFGAQVSTVELLDGMSFEELAARVTADGAPIAALPEEPAATALDVDRQTLEQASDEDLAAVLDELGDDELRELLAAGPGPAA